jgi:cbb3-type cytochrome oxidase maturation protein
MSILFVLVPLSLALVVFAGWAFFWAVGAGQFDDLESPGWEVLRDEIDVAGGRRLEAGAREEPPHEGASASTSSP